MTLNNTINFSRKNENLYHKLSLLDKGKYLTYKYFYPSNWLNLYLEYSPNPKEFFNNAFWRLNSDIFLDHYYKGITDPFVKEPAYAVFNLFPMASAVSLGINVGYSNNTFTSAHMSFAALRAIGKFMPLIMYYNAQDENGALLREKPGALDEYVKTALYYTDTIVRWIPYSNERIQADKNLDVYSPGFLAISIASGIARVLGSDLANPLAKSVQSAVSNLLTNTIATPLEVNIEGTTFSKIVALKNIIIGASEQQATVEAATNSYLTNFINSFSYITQFAEPALKLVEPLQEKFVEYIPYISSIITTPHSYISAAATTSIKPIIYILDQSTYAASYVISPLFNAFSQYTPTIFLKSNGEKTNLEHAIKRGSMYLIGAIVFDITKFIATNFVGTIILAPASRMLGIFAEEMTEFANDCTNILIEQAKNLPEYFGYQLYFGETGAVNDYDEL